ncbi:hypothetical protein Mapa_007546 [Marchantia paleacea]|nr:hypothetical protein Mapa_007546 [Marchantia paleacea]
MRSRGQLASFSMWVVALVAVLKLAEQVEINPLDLTLPDACEAVVQGDELESDGANHDSIPLQEIPPEHLPWLNFSRGEFLLENSNWATVSRSVQFSTGDLTLSRTAYNYVYLIRGSVTFKANESMQMEVEIQGALSIKTRELCARGCSTQGPTPAWFLYFASGGQAGSMPQKKAMVIPERDCGILVRFRYPKAKTSKTSLISGEMKSLRSSDDELQFAPIDIAAVYEGDFKYTRMEEVRKLADSSGSSADYLQNNEASEHSSVCESFEEEARLPVVWSSACGLLDSGDCSPFKKHSKMYDVRSTVTSVSIRDFDCSMDGKLSGHLVFAASDEGADVPRMSTHLVLVLEGMWDLRNEQFLMLACLLDAADCKIQVTLEVATIFRTITHPLAIFGHVGSLREKSDPLYFESFSFVGGGWLSVLSADSPARLQVMDKFDRTPSLRELIEPMCDQQVEQFPVKKWAKYPDGSDFLDMDLKTLVTNPSAASAAGVQGFALTASSTSTLPVFLSAMELGNARREWSFAQARGFPVEGRQSMGKMNVSFIVYVPRMQQLFSTSKEQWFKRMAAEGWFDRSTGRLCMLGCRSKIWAADGYDDDDTDGMDCSVLFNIRYPEVNPSIWGEVPHASGSITSLRSESDPLAFPAIALDSYYGVSKYQSSQTLWRKRVDIIMSVGTLCVLIVVLLPELVNSKDQSKHRLFACHSLIMLTALVTGHSVSLFFSVNIIVLKLSGSGSDDPSMRVTPPDSVELFTAAASMAALMLEMRWLYLTRKACAYADVLRKDQSSTRVAEHHVWYICLAIFGLAFTVVQLTFLSGQQLLASRYEESMYRRNHLQQMMWANLQASADVISYFFLLPQVLSRVLWDNKTRAPKSMYYYYLYMVLSLVRSLAQFYTVDLIFGPQFGDTQFIDTG